MDPPLNLANSFRHYPVGSSGGPQGEWVVNDKRVRLIHQGENLGYEVLNSAGQLLVTNLIPVPSELDLEEMKDYLITRTVIVWKLDQTPLFVLKKHSWRIGYKILTLLQGGNQFLWQLYDRRNDCIKWSAFQESLRCKLSVIQRIQNLYRMALQGDWSAFENCINHMEHLLKITEVRESVSLDGRKRRTADYGPTAVGFSVGLEPITLPSRIEPEILISAFKWTIRLIVQGSPESLDVDNHTIIVIQGVNDGYFNQESPRVCSRHYVEGSNQIDRCIHENCGSELHVFDKTMRWGDPFIYMIHNFVRGIQMGLLAGNEITYTARSSVWKRDPEQIKHLIDNIREEKVARREDVRRREDARRRNEEVPPSQFPEYHYLAGTPLAPRGTENCLTWSNSKLSRLGIDLMEGLPPGTPLSPRTVTYTETHRHPLFSRLGVGERLLCGLNASSVKIRNCDPRDV